MIRYKMLIITASVIWLFWGVFHVMGGTSLLVALSSASNTIPEVVQINMMGDIMPFHLLQTLKEHAFNNIWIGLVVVFGAVFGFKLKITGIFICSVIGGLAHVGFTFFMVIPSYAPMMGAVFSYLVAFALVPGLGGVFLKKISIHE